MQKLWSNTEPVTGSRFLVAVWPGALALLNLLAGKLWRSCGDCALTKKSGACAQQGGLGSSQHGNELLWDTEGQVGGEAKARHRGSRSDFHHHARPKECLPSISQRQRSTPTSGVGCRRAHPSAASIQMRGEPGAWISARRQAGVRGILGGTRTATRGGVVCRAL